MSERNTIGLIDAAGIIKDAIIRSRYQAARLLNKELLSLYYAVGKYVSANSRNGFWGVGAIKNLSKNLQNELPGLRGFSESSIKRMREFYEQWSEVLLNRPSAMGDLSQNIDDNAIVLNRPSSMGDLRNKSIDLGLLVHDITDYSSGSFSLSSFFTVGFTHHTEILAKEKSVEGRLFYISQCAENFWSVEKLKSNLSGELYAHLGSIQNNFMQTLSDSEQAHRAMRVFKDEYLLEFINLENEKDPDDRDERVLEQSIVANIKKFILSFGTKFCFIGSQYRVIVEGEENFIDLLFFHRELRCLVAVELKKGKFRPSQLGQLFFYLKALDEYVKQPDEAPSIGILLCKEANKNIVEFAVRDYSKPMGVATYKTKNEMPETWQKALPDFEDMRKLLQSTEGEFYDEVTNY